MPKLRKKLDEGCQPLERIAPRAEEARAWAEERGTRPELEAQLATRDELIREQSQEVTRLRQELDQVHRRDAETAQKIDLLEREKTEILAALESMNRSVGWKLVKRYRRLKDRFLPLGTIRRRLYDRWLIRLKDSPPPVVSQFVGQLARQRDDGAQPAPTDDFYQAQLVLLSAPTVWEAGKMGIARLEITNLSRCRWEALGKEPDGRGCVRVSYHWYDDSGKIVQWDGERTNLPHDLGSGDSVKVNLRVYAPFDPGTYTLEITLVQEGIAWFREKGSASIELSVHVDLSPIHLPELPACSLVVPVFNRAAFTKACLLAVEKSVSAGRLPHEVIVVDNGSTDETPELLRSWSSSRDTARVVCMGHNLGFARACNRAAALARGRYVVLLNNDTLPTPGWLEKMVALAEREPRVGIVGSKLLFPNGRIQHIGVAFDENKNPRHIYRGFRADIPPARISREYQAVTGACLLVRRDLYWLVGGMDESYQNSYEETDLCLRIRSRGYRVLVCADSVLYHFEGMSEGRRAADFRNTALFKARWENSIVSDEGRLYALDNLRNEWTEFEAQEGHHPGHERLLEEVWKRVYSEAFPKWEFASSSSEAGSLDG